MPAVFRRSRITAQFIIAATLAAPVGAQTNVSASLTATVQVIAPLSITVTHSLDFGKILVSTNKTVAPKDATGGHFELAGQGGSTITVNLMMPSELKPATGAPMPITGWNYIESDSPSLTGTAVSFAASTNAPFSATFQAGAGSTKMYFGVGATVQASASQAIGVYTGTGQLTAAYADL
jgi:hypothetical protein